MIPIFPIANVVDGIPTDSKHCRNGNLGNLSLPGEPPDRQSLFFGQLGESVKRSELMGCSSMPFSVVHVLRMRTSVKMRRIAAAWNVTRMESMKWCRIFANRNRKRNSVSHESSALQSNRSILMASSSLPVPALAQSANFDIGPEFLNVARSEHWDWLSIVISHVVSFLDASVRAVATLARHCGPTLTFYGKFNKEAA
jgi:hypothetical protein